MGEEKPEIRPEIAEEKKQEKIENGDQKAVEEASEGNGEIKGDMAGGKEEKDVKVKTEEKEDKKEEKDDKKQEKEVKEEKKEKEEIKEIKEEKKEEKVKEEKSQKIEVKQEKQENEVKEVKKEKEWDSKEVANFLREVIKKGNTEELTLKILRLSCEKQFPTLDTDQKAFKTWLKTTLVELLEEAEAEEEEDVEMGKEEEEEEEDEEEEEEQPKSRKRKRETNPRSTTKRASTSSKSSKLSSGGKGAHLSPELAAVVGTDSETNRFRLVKLLWQYIKEHDLQNPKDKREILCDEKLKAVFRIDKVRGFSMSKYLSDHIIAGEGADGAKDPPKKKAKKASGANMPFLSADLMKVCGVERGNHFSVVKHLWAYIKEHDLQNPKNKKQILCDKNLEAIFRKKTVTAFSMTKYISAHLIKPSEM